MPLNYFNKINQFDTNGRNLIIGDDGFLFGTCVKSHANKTK